MNIGATYFFSFFQLGLASIDIAFTKKRKAALAAGKPIEHNESLQLAMDILWQFVYWGTLTTGTILMMFYKAYWRSGHFSIGGKARFAMR